MDSKRFVLSLAIFIPLFVSSVFCALETEGVQPSSIKILEPTAQKPAIAGLYNKPEDFKAKVRITWPIDVGNFNLNLVNLGVLLGVEKEKVKDFLSKSFEIQIGGKKAEITFDEKISEKISFDDQGRYILITEWELNVSPPLQAKKGLYDIAFIPSSTGPFQYSRIKDIKKKAVKYKGGLTKLSIYPKLQTVNKGAFCEIDIAVSEIQDLYSVDINIKYKKILEARKVTPGQFLVSEGEHCFVKRIDIDNKEGRLNFVITRVGLFVDPICGSGILAKVSFYAKKAGTSEIKFDGVTLHNSKQEEISVQEFVSGKITIEVTETKGKIKGKVELKGKSDYSGTEVVILEIPSQKITTGEDGMFLFDNIDPGIYTLEAKHSNYILCRKKEIRVEPGEVTEVGTIVLVQYGNIAANIRLEGREDYSGTKAVLVETGQTIIANEKGEFLFEEIEPGEYTLKIRLANYIPWFIKVKVKEGETTCIEATLFGGDINQDCKVNIIDLIGIARKFGTLPTPGSEGDINGNGKIDIIDLVLTAKSYGKTDRNIPYSIFYFRMVRPFHFPFIFPFISSGFEANQALPVKVMAPKEAIQVLTPELVINRNEKVFIKNASSVQGVYLKIGFDAESCQVIDSDDIEDGIQIKIGDFFNRDSFVAVNNADNQKGIIEFAAVLLGDTSKKEGIIADIDCTGIASFRILEAECVSRTGRTLKASLATKKLPACTELLQNFPNPFNPETWIPYELSEKARVIIKIYNLAGQLIRILDEGEKVVGSYTSKQEAAYWDGKTADGSEVASGVYFYQLYVNGKVLTKQMVVLK